MSSALHRSYPAKLLLFGEYTVLINGDALAIPLSLYAGHWEEASGTKVPMLMREWCDFLNTHCADFLSVKDVQQLLNTHSYTSTIPIGAGLGSSGALTASVYDFAKKDDAVNLPELLVRMSKMESFFHGQSSGLDPLVSYLNQGILRSNSDKIKTVSLPSFDSLNVYLLDSGVTRKGKTFIQKFLSQSNSDPLSYKQLVDVNNKIIASCVKTSASESATFITIEEIQVLSDFQYLLMKEMIVSPLRDLWLQGIKSSHYAIKLCGAGGGGYYLVFSTRELDTLGHYPLIKLQ